MEIKKFDESELEVVGGPIPGSPFPYAPVFHYPVTAAEAVRRTYERKPVFQILNCMGPECIPFNPEIIPDNIARGFAGSPEQWGGKDMFGVEWVYVPSAMGSMEKPGHPTIPDANNLAENIKFPNIDEWDWEGAAKQYAPLMNLDKYLNITILTGWFERLISFMGFEEAAMALIDEDQQDAVKALFERVSDLYIAILERCFKYFPAIGIVTCHDDWGSQKSSFFSAETAEEMIVPYMKKVTDFIHANGRFADIHSCGHNILQVPNYIKAGWDSWSPQEMNDIEKIYDLYGDQILIGTLPECADMDDEEAQREAARQYVKKYCRKDKPSVLNMYYLFSFVSQPPHTQAMWAEIYKQSRIAYSE